MRQVRADLHRDGLLFPHVLYDHQVRTASKLHRCTLMRTPCMWWPSCAVLYKPLRYVSVQIEAEGLGKMAVAAGYQPMGLPQLVVQHAKVHIPPQPTW
jgi:hypothetical protein